MIMLIGRKNLRAPKLSDLESFGYLMQLGHQLQKTYDPYYARTSKEKVAEIEDKIKQAINLQNWSDLCPLLFVVDSLKNTFIGTVTRYLISNETHWPAFGITIYDFDLWEKGFGYEAMGS